jgi:hypothetical protein
LLFVEVPEGCRIATDTYNKFGKEMIREQCESGDLQNQGNLDQWVHEWGALDWCFWVALNFGTAV